MRFRDKNIEAFLELVKAGLWEAEVQLSDYHDIDWRTVYQLAQEQSILGLVMAGLEHADQRPQQELLLQMIGEVQLIEQRNKEVNGFVEKLFAKLRRNGVETVMVKGQGVAECYERPLWRQSGDVDLLLDERNYERAKEVLLPIAHDAHEEDKAKKHLGLSIMGVEVELHGRMVFSLSEKTQAVNDEVLMMATYHADEHVLIPRADEHVFLVFTHFLHHFFIEGVGLRQICDWCRMLYCYRETLDYGMLEERVRRAGLMLEWRAFYNLASRYLGMPDLDSSFMFQDSRYDKKADRIMELVLECGNFGLNKDLSYRTRYKGVMYKIVSLWRRIGDFVRFIPIFPLDAPKFFVTYVFGKMRYFKI